MRTSSQKKRVPLILWPFWALWQLLAWIVNLTGRLLAVALGLILMILGVIASITIVGAVVGIPLIVFGFLLIIRGLF